MKTLKNAKRAIVWSHVRTMSRFAIMTVGFKCGQLDFVDNDNYVFQTTSTMEEPFMKKCFGNFCSDKLSPLSLLRHRDGGTYDMGICPEQSSIATGQFCLLRIKVVPSEEDFVSCGVLVVLVQSLIAICSVNYVSLSKLPLR